MQAKEKLKIEIIDTSENGRHLYTKINSIGDNGDFFIVEKDRAIEFQNEYDNWYTISSNIINQFIPNRYAEFKDLHKYTQNDIVGLTPTNYSISDFWLEITIFGKISKVNRNVFLAKLSKQIGILNSVLVLLESSVNQVKTLLRKELYISEIDACKELINVNHLRAAGVIAGVVIEKHLYNIASNNPSITIPNKPTLAPLNELLKSNNIIDIVTWRNIQRLADIRNICAHNTGVEPTKLQVEDLIESTEKLITELI